MQIKRKGYHRLKDYVFSGLLPALLVFFVLFGLTLYSWNTARNNLQNERTEILQRENTNISITITQRFSSYENILRGGAGLFNSSTEVTRSEWQRYIGSFDIHNRFPGILGVGFLQRIPAEDLQQHIQNIRAEGYSDYDITPSYDRPEYFSTTFIDLFDGQVPMAYGYDIYTDETRRPAMDFARDNHQFTFTDKITLRSDQDQQSMEPSFIMFFPVYRGDSPPKSVTERRKELIGYIYSPFRVKEFANAALRTDQRDYGFELFNINNNKKELIFKSDSFEKIAARVDLREVTTIPIGSKQWQVSGVVSEDAVDETIRNRPFSVLFGGALFCAIAAGLIYMIIHNRTRAAAVKEKRGIQEAKDELLALASHQLRTPATGVKQYVGMLREGFAGPLSDLQRRLLEKAYESNERQLSTINEMLFVARADAGNLKMDYQTLDLTKLVKDTINEQAAAIRKRKQKVKFKAPKTPIMLEGDPVYLRMAIENIISNASKYTDKNGEIIVTLSRHKTGTTIKVRDTGVGVSPKDQALLFKKFSRIDNDLSNQVSGSGIGLYLSKKIIQSHGGKIQFESNLGSGSTVKITLPQDLEHKNSIS